MAPYLRVLTILGARMLLSNLLTITTSKVAFGSAFLPVFCENLNFFFFFAKIECGLYFLDRFDVLMSKIIFKK